MNKEPIQRWNFILKYIPAMQNARADTDIWKDSELAKDLDLLLQAERERCAKTVEEWTITTIEEQELVEKGVDDRKLIAKAIRGLDE